MKLLYNEQLMFFHYHDIVLTLRLLLLSSPLTIRAKVDMSSRKNIRRPKLKRGPLFLLPPFCPWRNFWPLYVGGMSYIVVIYARTYLFPTYTPGEELSQGSFIAQGPSCIAISVWLELGDVGYVGGDAVWMPEGREHDDSCLAPAEV